MYKLFALSFFTIFSVVILSFVLKDTKLPPPPNLLWYTVLTTLFVYVSFAIYALINMFFTAKRNLFSISLGSKASQFSQNHPNISKIISFITNFSFAVFAFTLFTIVTVSCVGYFGSLVFESYFTGAESRQNIVQIKNALGLDSLTTIQGSINSMSEKLYYQSQADYFLRNERVYYYQTGDLKTKLSLLRKDKSNIDFVNTYWYTFSYCFVKGGECDYINTDIEFGVDHYRNVVKYTAKVLDTKDQKFPIFIVSVDLLDVDKREGGDSIVVNRASVIYPKEVSAFGTGYKAKYANLNRDLMSNGVDSFSDFSFSNDKDGNLVVDHITGPTFTLVRDTGGSVKLKAY